MILYPDRIITGDGQTVMEDFAVCIREEKIVRLAPADLVLEKYPTEEVRRFPGASLLPGLCDMHAHLGYLPSNIPQADRNDGLLMLWVQNKLYNALKRGIVLLRDMASPGFVIKTAQLAAQRGWICSPHLVGVGAGMCITGGHFHFAYPGVVEVDSAENLIKAVRQRIKEGYTLIKLMTTDCGEHSEYTLEELKAAADEAHRLGAKITVHATNVTGIEYCIRAGVDGIEHACEMLPNQATRLAENGIAWTPTLLTYHTHLAEERAKAQPHPGNLDRFERAVNNYRKHFLTYARSGILTVAGTDLDALPIADELRMMVELGLTPLEAIRTATYNCAQLLELSDHFGLIEEGYEASLLLVNGNASKDITALKAPLKVFFKGTEVL